VFVVAVIASVTSLTHAAVVEATWLGGNGVWLDPARWSGGVVPWDDGNTQFDVRIPTGSVEMEPSFGPSVSTLTVNAPATLTIQSNSTVYRRATFDGHVHVHNFYRVGALTGSGTVTIDDDQPYGHAELSGGKSLVIPAGMHVQVGQNATLGERHTPFTNHGHIVGMPGAANYPNRIGGTQFSNLGTIEARDGITGFIGEFTRAGLGNLVWGQNGRFSIGFYGTLLNDGQTFTVDAANPWMMTGGTIRGGTLNIAAGSELLIPRKEGFSGGELDNVIVNGRIRHEGPAHCISATARSKATPRSSSAPARANIPLGSLS
jgi:hypothetical protein